jgi:hypothetical protein
MVASVGDPHDRTGRPEIDDLLDLADAEQRAAHEYALNDYASSPVPRLQRLRRA